MFLLEVSCGLLGIVDHNGVVEGNVNGEVVAEVVSGQLPDDLDKVLITT